MTSDSRITETSTWRRDAPIVRSVANSRVRCATVIEKVLKMTNAPTKRAIAPNASRKYRKIDVNSLTSSACSSASALALTTSAFRGRTDAMAPHELVLRDALLRGDGDRVVLTLAPEQSSCAAGIVNTTKLIAPRLSTSPYFATPTSSNGRFGCSVEISTVSPTAYPCSSAVPASMTTSSSAAGQRPSKRSSGLKRASAGSVSMPKPSVGQPSEFTASPSEVRIFVFRSSSTLPVASATSSTSRTTSRSEASTGGAGGFSPSIEMSRPLPVTTASVPAYESTRRLVNAFWTVSVRM